MGRRQGTSMLEEEQGMEEGRRGTNIRHNTNFINTTIQNESRAWLKTRSICVCFHFWRCLGFVSSLVCVCQSRAWCKTWKKKKQIDFHHTQEGIGHSHKPAGQVEEEVEENEKEEIVERLDLVVSYNFTR
jgi:hypothetical protein